MLFADQQDKLQRLTTLSLMVMEQRVSDGGLAQERNQPQVIVGEPLHPVTPGLVHAYCGPGGHAQSIEEAQLFATAPAMLSVLCYAHAVLSRDRGLSAYADNALAQIEDVVSKALASVIFDEAPDA